MKYGLTLSYVERKNGARVFTIATRRDIALKFIELNEEYGVSYFQFSREIKITQQQIQGYVRDYRAGAYTLENSATTIRKNKMAESINLSNLLKKREVYQNKLKEIEEDMEILKKAKEIEEKYKEVA